MPEKKEQNRFTIQFNPADPTHQPVIDILNRQGRRKAQFLVSAVQHYLHCPETPDIPQMSPIDTRTIEDIVRKILQHQDKSALIRESVKEHCRQDIPKAESFYYEETADLLDSEGLATIADTMEAFRKNSG